MPTAPPYNEALLLSRVAAGETEAFEAIYSHYQSDMTRFLVRYLKSPELAADCCQDVFLKVWEQREGLVQVRSFRAYLFIIARNLSLNILDRASRSSVIMGEITRHVLTRQEERPVDDTVLMREYWAYLQGLIEGLPPRAREVFKLCREQNYTYDQVAAELGISKNTVKSHMALSLKTLQTAVEKDLGIPLGLFFLIIYGH